MGTNRGHQWGDLLTAHGEIEMTVDTKPSGAAIGTKVSPP
jgi:hypothetical protein